MSIELVFKNWEDCFHMGSLHPKLRSIVTFVVNRAHTHYGRRMVVTSTFRDEGGVHGTRPNLRGIDLVPEDRDIEIMEKLRADTNEAWDYGKDPIEVCPPVRHGSAPHCHLQARNETKRREIA